MPKSGSFAGFSPRMLAFFRGLAKNNNREWFAPRKPMFEEFVKGPMVEVVGLINEALRAFAADYVCEPAHKAIYRIYRDTRFAKDKTPYKLHMAAHFQRAGITKNAGAGYFFAVSHTGVEIAGGMYMPGPEELAAVRGAIAVDAERAGEILNDRKVAKKVGPLAGEKLKRLPKGFEALAVTKGEELVKAKQWYWYITLPAEVALSKKLVGEVVSRFKLMREGVEWLNEAVLAARGEGEVIKRPEGMW